MKSIDTLRMEAANAGFVLRSYQNSDKSATESPQTQRDELCDSTSQSDTNSTCSTLSSMSSMTSCETDSLLASTNASVRGLYTRSPPASLCGHRPVLALAKPDFEGVFVTYGTIDTPGKPTDSTAVGKLKAVRNAANARMAEDLEANLAGPRPMRQAAYKRLIQWAFVKGNKPWTNVEALLFAVVFCLFLLALVGAWMSRSPMAVKGLM